MRLKRTRVTRCETYKKTRNQILGSLERTGLEQAGVAVSLNGGGGTWMTEIEKPQNRVLFLRVEGFHDFISFRRISVMLSFEPFAW